MQGNFRQMRGSSTAGMLPEAFGQMLMLGLVIAGLADQRLARLIHAVQQGLVAVQDGRLGLRQRVARPIDGRISCRSGQLQ